MSSTLKSIAVAVALLVSGASMAMAQNYMASGGAGTHSTAVKTGTASNTQKVFGNQNGYQPGCIRFQQVCSNAPYPVAHRP